jgi:2'-5' RNA ligase
VVEIPEADRDAVLAKVRAAWERLYPDAKEHEMPELLRASEPRRAADGETPGRDYFAALLGKLKERLGDKISQADLDAAHKHARASAGGKAAAKKRSQPQASAEPRVFADQPHTGFLVALWLDPATAQQLALPGGEAPDQLHCTIQYAGDASAIDDLTQARIIAAIDRYVSYRMPLIGEISGYGRFLAGTDGEGQDVFYASLDVEGLGELEDDIERAFAQAGYPVDDEHEFAPHITLAYLDPAAPNPVETLPDLDLRFSAVTIMIGSRRIDIPLAGFGPSFYSAASKEAGTWRLFVEQAQSFVDAPDWINVLPIPGSYQHPTYGTIAITPERNARFVDNFINRVYQQDLPITLDIEHDGKMSGAQAWVAELRQNADGSVDARVEWTERGRALVEAGAFRYFSPEWWDSWPEPATGKVYRDVLIGGAICVRPYFKEDALRPLVAAEGGLATLARASADRSVIWLQPLAATQSKEVGVPDKNEQSTTPAQMSEADLQQFREWQAGAPDRERAMTELQGQVKSLSEANGKLTTEARERKFTALVRDGGWPGDPAENVADLVAFAEAVGEESETFQHHVARMNAAGEALAASGAFTPIGTAETGANAGAGAWAQIETKARALMATDPKLSIQQATTAVMEAEPKLYAEYEREQRGR